MASLSSISIKRPVLATVFSLVIILFGVISFNYLGVREFPNVSPPTILVSTLYTGAGAGIIESQVTAPLEDAVNGIAGIKTISSESREEISNIEVEFELDTDLETAASDVRNKVSSVLWQLPPGAGLPSIIKSDADAVTFFYMSITGQRNLLELTHIANTYFKERIQIISGVSAVEIWGERKYAMRLWMDPAKLAEFKLTPSDVLNAIKKENVELPNGRITGQKIELTVRTMGRLESADEFNKLIIKEDGDQVVRFQDIGIAQLGAENDKTILRKNKIPGVAISVTAQSGSNIIEISNAIRKKLIQIKKDLPEDIRWEIDHDATKYVRTSISEIQQTLIIAAVLVLLVIFTFLRDWRTTLIPVVTIPISLIGSFFLMYVLNFTINVLTMLAIVLAIGLVVDDAIVVLENIYKKIEKGDKPKEAAREGSREIYFAVISTTVTLVAVFLPILFLEGMTGKLFQEFGIVISGAVIISSFVALTLTPMMSSKLLKREKMQSWLYSKTEPFFNRLSTGYARSLTIFMKLKWMAFAIIIAAGVLAYLLNDSIPSELAPMEDRSEFTFFAQAVEGATFEYMSTYVKKITEFIEKESPEQQSILSITSPTMWGGRSTNITYHRVVLKDPSQRARTQQEIVGNMIPQAQNFVGINTFISQNPTISGGGGGFPIQLVVQAGGIEKLRPVLPALMGKIAESPAFAFAGLNLRFNKPEIRVKIDRERARNLGVSVEDISQVLQLSYGESQFGNFEMDGKQYKIIGQLKEDSRDDPLDLKALYVRNRRGEIIQLDNLVTIEEKSVPPKLYRHNRYSSATINIQPAPGVVLSDGIEEIERITDNVLDETYNTSLSGTARQFEESTSNIRIAFLLALAIVYLVLAGQFESFIDPLIIMLTVPLALAGALGALWFFDQTINIFSQIGMIMLIGLVTKNGILIVEFANQRKKRGVKVLDAAINAAASRFRPILMTSLSTILGILPIALAWGAGAESRTSMGIAIIGGMVFASLLTLYVIPAFYVLFSKKTSALID